MTTMKQTIWEECEAVARLPYAINGDLGPHLFLFAVSSLSAR